jgi:type II secretory pathway predicted ATPase ExeA
MGKTALLHKMLSSLPITRTAFVFDSQCSFRDLIQQFLRELRLDPVDGAAEADQEFERALVQRVHGSERIVIVIDEAQNLAPSVMDRLRQLSKIESPGPQSPQFVFSGLPELSRKLSSQSLWQLRRKIATFTRLEPIAPEETPLYVEHRLKVAGYSGRSLFTPAALESLYQFSGGVPRNINRLCFGGLSLAYRRGRDAVDDDMVREVGHSLQLERSPAGRESVSVSLSLWPANSSELAAGISVSNAKDGSMPPTAVKALVPVPGEKRVIAIEAGIKAARQIASSPTLVPAPAGHNRRVNSPSPWNRRFVGLLCAELLLIAGATLAIDLLSSAAGRTAQSRSPAAAESQVSPAPPVPTESSPQDDLAQLPQAEERAGPRLDLKRNAARQIVFGGPRPIVRTVPLGIPSPPNVDPSLPDNLTLHFPPEAVRNILNVAPFSPRLNISKLSNSEVETILSQPPQRQAEELLQAAIAEREGATEIIYDRLEQWRGQLRATQQFGALERAAGASTDPRVRIAVAKLRLDIEDRTQTPPNFDQLVRLAEHNPARRPEVFAALAQLGYKGIETARVIRVLQHYAFDPDERTQSRAIDGLATVGTGDALSILLRLSHSGFTRTQREHAGEVLANAGLYTQQERMIVVRTLIDLASRSDADSETIRRHFQVLREITHVNLPDNARAWRKWFQQEARARPMRPLGNEF